MSDILGGRKGKPFSFGSDRNVRESYYNRDILTLSYAFLLSILFLKTKVALKTGVLKPSILCATKCCESQRCNLLIRTFFKLKNYLPGLRCRSHSTG